MTEQEFLNTGLAKCSCSNKVKPSIVEVQDMNARLRCPEIKCSYCGSSSGSFMPGEFKQCLGGWSIKKTRTFDEILKEIHDHIAEHKDKNADVPPFKLTKQDALIAFSMLNEMNKKRMNQIADAVLDGAINSAINDKDYSYFARMLREEMVLMGVTLAVGWGKREAVTGETEEQVRRFVDNMGSDPNDCMILQSAGRYVTTAMDYR